MEVEDLLTLYCISKGFHGKINGHMAHVMKMCARRNAKEAASVYLYGICQSLCMRDPARRPHKRNLPVPRWVPSLKWPQMVYHREKTVRGILACLARAGHRTPKDMHLTVTNVWLVMDTATTAQRITLCHNEAWFTDIDLSNAQLFLIKLLLRCNEPLGQMGDGGLVRVFLGQRGLTPFCKLLKRETYMDEASILKMCVKYCYYPKPEHEGLQIFCVKPENIGKGRREGRGKGKIHLLRIDEVVMREITRRKLRFNHLTYLVL